MHRSGFERSFDNLLVVTWPVTTGPGHDERLSVCQNGETHQSNYPARLHPSPSFFGLHRSYLLLSPDRSSLVDEVREA